MQLESPLLKNKSKTTQLSNNNQGRSSPVAKSTMQNEFYADI
jgi:hypothetical protein